MSSFTTPLRVEILDESREGRVEARVLEAFTYCIGAEDSADCITVPAGFVTDFASIPRGLWNIEPPLGRSGKAAVIHDYLYKTHIRTRPQADKIFSEAMAVLGVPWYTRTLMYSAVRAFGQGGYDRDGRENK